MTLPRLAVVAAPPPGALPRYEGMDRTPLAPGADASEELVARVAALEDRDPRQALDGLLTVMSELDAGYDLLWLGDDAPDGWEPLGYDVGETTSAAWSAIARWPQFLSPEEFETWRSRLNEHGLFQRADAEEYLAAYLAADDPDRGWSPDGWTDTPGLYAVVPVWRGPR
jgi:hypothetical protein